MATGAWLRAAVLGLSALTLAAAADPALTPGLWEVRNTPGVATLDGKVLDDLPLGEARTRKICVLPKQAADPVAFFARDTQADCKIVSASAAGGKVDIKGSCLDPEEGSEGTMRLSGRYGADSYEIDFASKAEDFQGVMTFSGKLSGRRIGPCPSN